MADDLQDLRTRLSELHTQLEAARSLDPESQALLRQLMADIEQALARGSVGEQQLVRQHTHRGSLIRRLGDATRGFESTHPMLSGAVGSVIDALSRMGI
jgi:hypothetical protein